MAPTMAKVTGQKNHTGSVAESITGIPPTRYGAGRALAGGALRSHTPEGGQDFKSPPARCPGRYGSRPCAS